ncbi:DNA-directed RNA polymerases I and III subunit RPAC1-like [Pollicipes pollicipes]|uniref:DNA-directed RNA polymerases I and III subunit RPAC1-like n=1 Tax=Pollicipes pollicipes TaxID=41117 RepID=UPI0018858BAD|nr:DNA-directed RNA polymerases I and III subunit RPAC1-like [Pollicipes pollicipes]XP_037074814.1 DNA-directed RNA polymerases I and III subunit RPAC1-like [Pollicipes pollicipes]XP_037074815.1 DNA-directed RNA polymerases I and III subunit RPAC1-like [Pollicipes pollicipes]
MISGGRNKVILKEYETVGAEMTNVPGSYSSCDDTYEAWHKRFKEKFKAQFVKLTDTESEFDLIGIDAPIANAFRRILIAEVPSMAIEKVHIYNNTSILQDEVLAHRMGLIPLKANPLMFEYKGSSEDAGKPEDTLEFELKVKCKVNPNAPSDAANPAEKYINSNVYSGAIKFCPHATQEGLYTDEQVGTVHQDILIAKMRPGHEIDLKLHAVKGIGRDHAKFSPVATAFYRLLPEVTLTREVRGEWAEKLQKCFSPGVILLEDGPSGEKIARVGDARYDNCSRNVYRYDELKDAVVLGKVKDHFIFSIESVGAQTPEVLFAEAAKVMLRKCEMFIAALDEASSKAKE